MRQQSDAFDIIVVGGGAIGAALALELGRLGYRLAVIESRPPHFEPNDPERVIALTHGSRRHLESLGVWGDIAAAGYGRIGHVHVSEPGNRGQVDLDVADAPAGTPGIEALGYVLEMADVLRPMYQRLGETATLLCPAQVAAVDSDADAVRVRLNMDGRERTLSARLLIAADGTASPVRRMCGIGTLGWDHNRFALVASPEAEKGHADVAYECFRPAGPLAFLPLADGRCSIVWTLAPREAAMLLQAPGPVFLKRLEREAGPAVLDRLGALAETGARALYPLELTLAERFASGRVILAGNAAHTLHPVAGQGMNLGLRDVADLADILGRSGGDPGAAIGLEAYAQRRWLDVARVVGFTESLAAIFGGEAPVLKWARGWGLQGLQAASPLRELLVRQAAGIAPMRRSLAQPGRIHVA
jgi:ubiquinone biosynthesis UbiH/UbiF/VisC/COQ6 family hydroxylase